MLASSNAKQCGVEFKPTSRVHLDNILEMLSDNILDNISKMLYRKGLFRCSEHVSVFDPKH